MSAYSFPHFLVNGIHISLREKADADIHALVLEIDLVKEIARYAISRLV